MLLATPPLYAQTEAEVPSQVPLCSACHGPNGASMSPTIPSLAGQNESYLFKRLIELKTQPTPSETMRGVTHDISEADLRHLANFFARQPYVRNQQQVSPEQAARGRDVYARVCNACHKEEGRATIFADYPLLAGQSVDYMLNEIDHILSRKREVEAIKSGTLAPLPREQIVDAIIFFASQQVSPEQVKTIVNGSMKRVKHARGRD